MINIWRQDGRALLQVDGPEPDCWIHVSSPNNYEISRLVNEFSMDLDLLNDILDIDEQSRTEKEDDKLLFIMRVPIYNPEREVPYFTVPLGIVFFDSMIMTICLQDGEVIQDLIDSKVKNFSLLNRKTFLLTIFFRSSFYYLRYLKEINKKTAAIEKELQKAIKNNELIQLLAMEKSLVFFTTSLKTNELLMEKIQKTNIIKMNEEDVELIEDVVTENKQAIEMSNIYSNILSGMMDAFASVISNNLNVVLKQLTSISLILMIPTLIASIYGMNIALPFQRHPYAFAGTLIISAAFSLVSIVIFRWKQFF